MAQNQEIKPGDDVTSLMSAPQSGDDVTHLMPEMNFAIVNGQKVPLNDESYDPSSDIIEPGNIDLYKQPKIKNPETGGTSTVFSTGVNIDGKEYLLPRVTPDGRFLSEDEAVNEFKKTGKHLGAFKNISASNRYAEQLHRDYESGKYDGPNPDEQESPLQKLLKPIVDVSPETRQHMAEFEQVHPFLGSLGRNAVDLTVGQSSPLALGLMGLGAGETAAAKLGFDKAASLLRLPSRAAGAGLAYHGLSDIDFSKNSLGQNAGDLLQVGLGGLALKGPSSVKRLKFNKFLDSVPEAELADEQNLRLNPQTDEKFAGDSLVKTELPNSKSLDAEPNQSLNPIPGLNIEQPITAKDQQFVQNWKDQVKSFLTNEQGSVDTDVLKSKAKIAGLKARDALFDALTQASPLRGEQEQLYSQERANRISKANDINTPGFQGLYQKLGALKGELPKVDFTPLTNLHGSTKASLLDQITRSNLKPFEKIRASVGLAKILGEYGDKPLIPQRGEIDLLGKVFGSDFADKLTMMHSGLPVTTKALNEVANFTKSIMASVDLSAPLRQGLPLIHKPEFWNNLAPMIKYAWSPEFYNSTMRTIEERPNYQLGQNSGLKLTALGEDISQREEAFMSRLAEKIPGVPASERAYTGFLNKLRSDVFDNLIKTANDLGEETHKSSVDSSGAVKTTPNKLSKDIASFVNTATGRGSLGRFEKNAIELNYALFSPRMISSRLTMLNPKYYIDLSPLARREALKSLFAVAGAGTIVSELGRMAGGTIENDPRSSDFRKVKIGNTRLDPYGGFQQYIVAASKLISGSSTSSTSGKNTEFNSSYTAPTGFSVVDNLRRGKMSPIASFIEDYLRGTDFSGKPFNLDRALVSRITPMLTQDLYDLAKSDPTLLPILGPAATLGMGVQTFDQATPGLKPLSASKPLKTLH